MAGATLTCSRILPNRALLFDFCKQDFYLFTVFVFLQTKRQLQTILCGNQWYVTDATDRPYTEPRTCF